MSGLPIVLPDEVVDALVRELIPRICAQLTVGGPESWVGVEQAANHLGCKRQRIYDLVSQKDSGIPYRKEGSRLLFKRSQLDAWLDRGARG